MTLATRQQDSAPQGGEIELINIVKTYDGAVAVDDLSLQIESGEFYSLLGPSGCGKTTTLRCLAGFEIPDAGQVCLDGREITGLPPHRRSVNTVFQSYALFPFLDVADNVAFGLKYHRVPRSEIRQRVGDALELVRLNGYERRRPSELSGGQQQRVALARALVLRPSVLLLDEPLGALDAKLRRVLQVELKALQEQLGVTFVYVTHDQEEALTMSDRIAVMSQGRVQQIGTPRTVYEEPTNAYVADFLGISNLMPATVTEPGSGHSPCRVALGDFSLAACCGETAATGAVKLAVRPERVVLHPFGTGGPNHVPGMVERIVFLGSASQVFLTLAPGVTIQALIGNARALTTWTQGTPVSAELPAESLRVLPERDEAGPPMQSAAPGLLEPHGQTSDDHRATLYEEVR
jgi:spermidine/putrescine transport system ATP-binding protein